MKTDIQITMLAVVDIESDPRNARKHPAKQVEQIAANYERFGYIAPLLVNGKNRLIAGHGRLLAAKKLKLIEVPVIRMGDLNEREELALALADNKVALNSSWDEELLADALRQLSQFEEIDFTGFSTAEQDNILSVPTDLLDDVDAAPAIDRTVPSVTRTGDLWEIGPHRIICADALKPETYSQLMVSGPARQVVTDLPYNVRVEDISGLGRNKHAEFAMASGEMDRAGFTEFLFKAFERMKENVVDGAIGHAFMDWRHILELQAAADVAGWLLKNMCVWVKNNGGMGSLYRSQHELCFVYKYGTAPHVNNVELGKDGRYRTNVWEYAGANSFGRTRRKDLATHPTVKPLAMIMDAIKDCSKRGDIILDPFGGSGTTLLAAERTGRVARLVEIDPYYVDATIRRVEAAAGRKALLAGTGESFAEVKARREAEALTPATIAQQVAS